jgi:maleate cis-trans isomerase
VAEILDMAETSARPTLLATPRARVGLIIPSSNRLTEPQFRYYLPADIGVHVTRMRMTGPYHRPLDEIGDGIREAAGCLADSECDAIVFHCTGGAMSDGAEAEARVVDLIRSETGKTALATGEVVVEALTALEISRPVLISPYVQATNDAEKVYLESIGISVVNDVALGLPGGSSYIQVPPERWLDEVRGALTPEADGVFLSCTNTTQIEIVEAAEIATGLPAVNSNQAVIWRVLKEFGPGTDGTMPGGPGRLFGSGS